MAPTAMLRERMMSMSNARSSSTQSSGSMSFSAAIFRMRFRRCVERGMAFDSERRFPEML